MPTLHRIALHGHGLWPRRHSHPSFGQPPEQQEHQALWLYFGQTVLGAVMSVVGKLCSDEGTHFFALVAARSALLCLLLLPMLYRHRINPFAINDTFWLLLLRGFMGFASLSLWYLSLGLLPLSDATALSFVSPVLVALAAPTCLGEPTPRAVYVSLPLCMAGMLMVAQPCWLFGSLAGPTSTVGVLAGIAQAVFSTVSKLIIRCLNRHNEPLECIMFSMGFCCLLGSVLGCLALPGRQLAVPPTAAAWGYLAATSFIAFAVQAIFTAAMRKCNAAKAASLDYLSLLWMLVADATVFRKLPNGLSLTGACIITVASLGAMLWSYHHPCQPSSADNQEGDTCGSQPKPLQYKQEFYLGAGASGSAGKHAAAATFADVSSCSEGEAVSLIKAAQGGPKAAGGSVELAAGPARILEKILGAATAREEAADGADPASPAGGVSMARHAAATAGNNSRPVVAASWTTDSTKSWRLGTEVDAAAAAAAGGDEDAPDGVGGLDGGPELRAVTAAPPATRTSSEKERALLSAGK